jgi:endonuclease YncB( thermonuclease family)
LKTLFLYGSNSTPGGLKPSYLKNMTISCATTTAILLLTALVFAEPPKVVEQFTGRVIGVTDGDTVKVLVDKQAVTVRLEGIDAPEKSQSFGAKSKEALAKLVAGKAVTVRKTGTDKYGRILGVVIVGNVDANAKLVEDGWAWHYKVSNSDQRLAKLEEAARTAKRGLWADEKPLAPWEFRARQQTPQAAPERATEQKTSYWLNTSSGVRHNQRCEHFQKTKKGRFCGPNEGKPCGICGG